MDSRCFLTARPSLVVSGLLLISAGCSNAPDRSSPVDAAPARPSAAKPGASSAGPPLVSREWRIVKMATARDMVVIEVEARDPSKALEIARALTEPIKENYSEALVYVRPMGEATMDGDRRVRWTRAGGYVELEYGGR